MPKILIYISSKITWIFLFYGTDLNENRAHVHVGKRGTDKYCKIWLVPEITVADKGDLTDVQIKQILAVARKYKSQLLTQWQRFKEGKNIRIIMVKE